MLTDDYDYTGNIVKTTDMGGAAQYTVQTAYYTYDALGRTFKMDKPFDNNSLPTTSWYQPT